MEFWNTAARSFALLLGHILICIGPYKFMAGKSNTLIWRRYTNIGLVVFVNKMLLIKGGQPRFSFLLLQL